MKHVIFWTTLITAGGAAGYFAGTVYLAILGGAVIGLVWSQVFYPLIKD